MSEQLAIDAVVSVIPAKDEGEPLTDRQRLAFDYVRERDGVSADEVGAFLHAHKERRPHSVDERCDYCARDGRSVLGSKALKPLVTYRKDRGGRLYIARDKRDRVRAATGGLIATSNSDPAVNPWADLDCSNTPERT